MLSRAGIHPTGGLSALWPALPPKAWGRAALLWSNKFGIPFESGCSLAPPSCQSRCKQGVGSWLQRDCASLAVG